MIVIPLWQTLKDLVSLDDQLITIQKNIIANNKLNEKKQADYTQKKSKLEQLEATLFAIKKEVKLQELTVETITTNLTKKKQARAYVTTTKELQALEHELVLLEHKQQQEDEKLLTLWNSLETTTKLYEQERVTHMEVVDSFNKEISAITTTTQELTTTQNSLVARRSELAARVAPEWLTNYENMRTSVENPIVSVTNNVCSSCFYDVAAQDLACLKKSGLLPCKNCYRLLYYESTDSLTDKQ